MPESKNLKILRFYIMQALTTLASPYWIFLGVEKFLREFLHGLWRFLQSSRIRALVYFMKEFTQND